MFVDNKYINIKSDFKINGSVINFNINSFKLVDYDLFLQGELKVDYSKDEINYFGKYQFEKLIGDVRININKDISDIYLDNTNTIKDIKFVKKFITLPQIAEEWMYDNVSGDMKLDYFYAKFDPYKKKIYVDSFEGFATIDNAVINFVKGVDPVNTKKVNVTFNHNNLAFELIEPKYKSCAIDGSNVLIENLDSAANGLVNVNIKTLCSLNNDILKILDAYHIKLPVKQLKGQTDATLSIKVPYSLQKHMDVEGSFYAKNSKFSLNDFSFNAKTANVFLKNSIVDINNSDVSYEDILNANLNLRIDTNTSTAVAKAQIKNFDINTKDTSILKLKNTPLNIDIDFKNDTKLVINDLNTTVNLTKNDTKILVGSLSKVYSNSQLLKDLGVKEGDLSISLKDKDNLTLTSNIKAPDFPILIDGKKPTDLTIQAKMDNGNIFVDDTNDNFQISMLKDEPIKVLLKDMAIDISNNLQTSQNDKYNNADIKLENVKLKVDENTTYDIESGDAIINKKGVDFSVVATNLDLPIAKNFKKITRLNFDGNYSNKVLKLNSGEDLKFQLDDNKNEMDIYLKNYDLLFDTKLDDLNKKQKITLNGENTNILINNQYKLINDSINIIVNDKSSKIEMKNKENYVKISKDNQNNIYIEAKNLQDEYVNNLVNKKLFEGGNVNITASGNINSIKGKAFLQNTKINDLALLNNLLMVINTSPAIINPLLAIPSLVDMAVSKGFNINGYRVVEGEIDFIYNFDSKILELDKISTKGNGIDFNGKAKLNFADSTIDSDLNLVFFKTYSKIVGAIPIINYVFLGDEKRVETEVNISGTIEDPKYETNLTSDSFEVPVNIFKRIITSPTKLYDYLNNIVTDDENNSSDSNDNNSTLKENE